MNKIISLIVTLVLCVGTLAACSGTQTSAPDSSNPPEATASTAESQDSEALGDPGFYQGVTAMDKASVEAFASRVRAAYLSEDWGALSDSVRYPITVNETQLDDADAFLNYMAGMSVHESDRAAMEEETCHDMFNNGEGICLGSGQLWLIDPNYMTDAAPELQIFAISGIVKK